MKLVAIFASMLMFGAAFGQTVIPTGGGDAQVQGHFSVVRQSGGSTEQVNFEGLLPGDTINFYSAGGNLISFKPDSAGIGDNPLIDITSAQSGGKRFQIRVNTVGMQITDVSSTGEDGVFAIQSNSGPDHRFAVDPHANAIVGPAGSAGSGAINTLVLSGGVDPSTVPSGTITIFNDSGTLKAKFPNGTIRTIASP